MSTPRQIRGTEASWLVSTIILEDGQLGYDTTNNILKMGNGINLFKDLATINYSEHCKCTNILDENGKIISSYIPDNFCNDKFGDLLVRLDNIDNSVNKISEPQTNFTEVKFFEYNYNNSTPEWLERSWLRPYKSSTEDNLYNINNQRKITISPFRSDDKILVLSASGQNTYAKTFHQYLNEIKNYIEGNDGAIEVIFGHGAANTYSPTILDKYLYNSADILYPSGTVQCRWSSYYDLNPVNATLTNHTLEILCYPFILDTTGDEYNINIIIASFKALKERTTWFNNNATTWFKTEQGIANESFGTGGMGETVVVPVRFPSKTTLTPAGTSTTYSTIDMNVQNGHIIGYTNPNATKPNILRVFGGTTGGTGVAWQAHLSIVAVYSGTTQDYAQRVGYITTTEGCPPDGNFSTIEGLIAILKAILIPMDTPCNINIGTSSGYGGLRGGSMVWPTTWPE